MAEKRLDVFNGRAVEQEFNGERIAETVRVAFFYFSVSEKRRERFAPLLARRFEFPVASPEPIPLAYFRSGLELLHDKLRERAVNMLAGLLSVEPNFPILQSIYGTANYVTKPQAGIAQEENERAHETRSIAAIGTHAVNFLRAVVTI